MRESNNKINKIIKYGDTCRNIFGAYLVLTVIVGLAHIPVNGRIWIYGLIISWAMMMVEMVVVAYMWTRIRRGR